MERLQIIASERGYCVAGSADPPSFATLDSDSALSEYLRGCGLNRTEANGVVERLRKRKAPKEVFVRVPK